MSITSAHKPNFHGIPRQALKGNNIDDFELSRSGSISRKRIEQAEPMIAGARFPDQSLQNILSSRSGDLSGVLVKIPIPYLPANIARGIEAAGLTAAVRVMCSGLVVCTHLRRLGEYRSGFVIDGRYIIDDTKRIDAEQIESVGKIERTRKLITEHPLPPFFHLSQVNRLAGGFLDNPFQTIFVNGYYDNGAPRSGLGFLPSIILDLGHLIYSHKDPGLTFANTIKRADQFFRQILGKMDEDVKRELGDILKAHQSGE